MVDLEAGDVVGGEAQALLVVLVDRDAVGVDVHREPGERAGVFHFAHAEDRDRLQQRADAGADDVVGDLGGVLPCEHGLESGGATFGEHRRDRAREHVVGLVEEQRHAPALLVWLALLGLDLAVEQREQQLHDRAWRCLRRRGLWRR